MDDLIYKQSCHVFRNRGTCLCPESTKRCANKTWHGCQNVARFYGTRSGLSFSKSAFFTVSLVKFKPLIGFWCRFRLHAPHTYLYHNLQKKFKFPPPKKSISQTSHKHLFVKHSNTDFPSENPNLHQFIQFLPFLLNLT